MGYIIEAADRFQSFGIDSVEAIADKMADKIIEQMAKAVKSEPSKTFEIGTEYYGTFACDSDSQAFIKIIGRTGKQVKFVSVYNGETRGEVKRVKIFLDSDGVEYIFPFGKCSMALIIRASRKA